MVARKTTKKVAADQQEQSVGVILSGMGRDGTPGLRAIKQMAGIVSVQTPVRAALPCQWHGSKSGASAHA